MKKKSRKLSRSEIEHIVQPVLWDYHIDPYAFYELALGQRERIGLFTPDRALRRLLERLSWYELLYLFGVDFLRKRLTRQVIATLHNPDLKRKYEFVRKILQGETVHFSGWDSKHRQPTQHTLLSHRWYRIKPSLF